jgi:putative colanic acid biosynthesis glycosyltransferase WcaI
VHVLILSQYYDPEPVPKPAELAQSLQQKGHQVTVITGFPSYPMGDLYGGYRLRLIRRETIDMVPIIRTYEYPSHGKHALGRFANYLSFMLSAPLGAFFVRRCDVIYVYHPPLTVGVVAWILSHILGSPVVYDVQDIWPESIVASGLLSEGRIYRFLSRLERFVYKRMHQLIVVTEGAKQNLIRKGVSESKITVLPHWVDETQFQVLAEPEQSVLREFQWEGRFIILFAGNLGFVQGLDTVVRAAALLPKESRLQIVFMGQGTAENDLRALVKQLDVSRRVQFISPQPPARMPQIMGSADVLLVHLRRSPIIDFVIPSKTFSYLAAGRPILMAMGGAGNDLIRESKAGIAIEPDDPALLARTMVELSNLSPDSLRQYGENGRNFLTQRLNKKSIIKRYLALLSDTAKQDSGSSS